MKTLIVAGIISAMVFTMPTIQGEKDEANKMEQAIQYKDLPFGLYKCDKDKTDNEVIYYDQKIFSYCVKVEVPK